MSESRREPQVEIVTEEESYALALPQKQTADVSFAELWSNAYTSSEEGLRAAWIVGRDDWLRTKEGKSGSRHTRRSYEHGSGEWIEFIATLRHGDGSPVKLWQATAEHVRSWQQHLDERGLAGSSINQRLAACSSWYSFMGRERFIVNGFEISPFMDRAGRFRSNPFAGSNVQRAPTEQYGHARILTNRESDRLLTYLQDRSHTVTGSRNYALILCYLLTGYRNNEVVSMRWGAIRPNRNQPGAWVVEWTGKGGKSENDPLPNRVYYALIHYLQMSGRDPDALPAEEHIFQPIVTHGQRNLRNVTGKAAPHISTKQAETILHTALRKAGVENPTEVRVHDLRHTFAHRFRRNNSDLESLRARLHHESLATTGIYAREVLEDPVDDYSEGVYQSMFQF